MGAGLFWHAGVNGAYGIGKRRLTHRVRSENDTRPAKQPDGKAHTFKGRGLKQTGAGRGGIEVCR